MSLSTETGHGLRAIGAIIAFCALLLSTSGNAHAATKTWDGSGNMSTAANWDSNTLPTDGDTILFNGTSASNATWDSTFASSYSNLVVRVESGYTGTITLGASATIASSTIAAGTFNIATHTLTANGAMTVAGGTVTTTFGSGTEVFNDDLVLNSGTYLPASETTVKGDWLINGGTLVLNEAHMYALTFAGTSGAQTFRPGASSGYCDVEINNTTGGSTDTVLVDTDALAVYCSLTITNGVLDMQTNNIPFQMMSAMVVADDADAGLMLGTGAVTFDNNIQIGASASLSTASTTYTFGPNTASTYYVTSTVDHKFNGTFLIEGSCSAANTVIFSGGLGTTHLRVTKGIADFRTKNAQLDADGTVLLDNTQAGTCAPGTYLALKWGTGQFNVGGNFTQKIGGTGVTAGTNTIIFDGTGDQFVSSTAQFDDVHIRKSSGTLFPGTTSVGSSPSNVMFYWNVVDVTVATGTLDFSSMNVPMIVSGDFLVSGASTSILLPSGTTGVSFRGNALMTAAGSWTPGTATTTILTTVSGTQQLVGASAGTMSLGKIAVSSTMIIPAGYSLTVERPSVTTSLGYVRVDGGTLTITTTGSEKMIAAAANQYSFQSTSTVRFTGSGTIPSGTVYAGSLTLDSSGSSFTLTSSSTVMRTLTVTSGTTLVISGGVYLTVPSVGTIVNSGTITETGIIKRPHESLIFANSSGSELTAVAYQSNGSLYVSVTDLDANLSGTSQNTLSTIRVYSDDGDAETITMTETGVATGIFLGSVTIQNTGTVAAENGILEISSSGELEVAYIDSKDSTDAATTTVAASLAAASSSGTAFGSGQTSSQPSAPVMSLNGGAAMTSVSTVTVAFQPSGSPVEVALSENPEFIGGVWQPYAATLSYQLSSQLGTKTVYAKLAYGDGSVSKVAVATIALVASATPAAPPSEPSAPQNTVPNPGVIIPFGLSVGDLVKVAGNSAVYFIDATGTRRAFPTETVYSSWYGKDFSKVKTITTAQLATFALGKNMTIKPGTYLIKITTVPKVYAIVAEATLQWVSTEARAIELYGAGWAKKVVDVPDAYFVDYTIIPGTR